MKGELIDGNDIIEVYNTIKKYADKMRVNPAPVLIEAKTFRIRGHEEASGIKYVPKNLIDKWKKKDPSEIEKITDIPMVMGAGAVSPPTKGHSKVFNQMIENVKKSSQKMSTSIRFTQPLMPGRTLTFLSLHGQTRSLRSALTPPLNEPKPQKPSAQTQHSSKHLAPWMSSQKSVAERRNRPLQT